MFGKNKMRLSNFLGNSESNNLTNIPNQIQKIIFIKSNLSIDINTNILDSKFESDIESNTESNDLIKTKILDKKILHITPAGLYGFYDVALCEFIKNRYNLDNHIFNGASAGAWNGLFMVYKYNNTNLLNTILNNFKQKNTKSIKSVQLELKNLLLTNTATEDFEFDKLFITVSVWENYKLNNYVYTDFESLESAIDCCIASSNIPLLTGDIIYKYKGKISLDGGFLSKSHIIVKEPDFIITNSLFGRKRFFTSLFDLKKNILDLYVEGLDDCVNNVDTLDKNFKLY